MARVRRRINSRFFVFLTVLIGIAALAVVLIIRNRHAGEITYGSIGAELDASAVIIRDETIVSTENYEKVVFMVVEGEVSNDDFSGGLRLRAKRVMSLEEARTGLAESLRVRVAADALKGDRMRWLGWGEVFRAWGRILKLMTTHRELWRAVRTSLRAQTDTPKEVLRTFGYALFVGRKPGA